MCIGLLQGGFFSGNEVIIMGMESRERTIPITENVVGINEPGYYSGALFLCIKPHFQEPEVLVAEHILVCSPQTSSVQIQAARLYEAIENFLRAAEERQWAAECWGLVDTIYVSFQRDSVHARVIGEDIRAQNRTVEIMKQAGYLF